MTGRRWKIKQHNHLAAGKLAAEIGVRPVIAALLIDRGFETVEAARRFLNPELNQLHDPKLLKDLDKAVGRILRAIDSGEKILIWGDYDVDGTPGPFYCVRPSKPAAGNPIFIFLTASAKVTGLISSI